MKTLCTFSGCFGDVLWSLPTAKAIAEREGEPVDFAMMPQYSSLIPLLRSQVYIDKAFSIAEWTLEHQMFGCQPWQSPFFEGRERYNAVVDLTYRQHPYGIRLAEWIARDAGVQLQEPLEPFLTTNAWESWKAMSLTSPRTIAVGFGNPHEYERKQGFLNELQAMLSTTNFDFVDVTKYSWLEAAEVIKHSFCFLGCRSSNYVLAHGVGQQHLIVFEPHPGRCAPVFDRPNEDVVMTAEQAMVLILKWS